MANKQKVLSNFIWRFSERCGAQGVAFVVSMVLARVLDPEAYGTVALVTVLIAILQTFVDSGFGNALIQKKDADDLDFSSVFYFNVIICSLLYVAIWFLAPLFATFYSNTELISIVRALGLLVVISGVKNVQQAYVSKQLLFKKFFFATLGGTIGAAILGIIMAYKGFGVWALVAQQLFNSLVDTIILWVTVKWRPKRIFSIKRLAKLFQYGWKLLVSALLDRTYNELRQLIIGKMYSTSSLAYYNKGRQFPNFIINNINSSINSVLLPSMSKEQDNVERVRNMTRRSIKISTYVMAPLMIGLAAIANPLIELILTEKWLPCVPFLRIFCITYMFYPIHTANLNAIKAMGRSDLFLKLEVIKKVVGLTVLMSSMWFGVMAMAYSLLFTSFASQIINSWPNKKLLNYSYRNQLWDIFPSIGLALFMGICVKCVEIFKLDSLYILGIQILLGALIYIWGSYVMKMDSFDYILDVIKTLMLKKKTAK